MSDGIKMIFWIGVILVSAYLLSAIFLPDMVEGVNLPSIRINLSGYF